MIWAADRRREHMAEEAEQASRGLAAAAVLVCFAALSLPILPAAVLLFGATLEWLSPAFTALAAVLAGTKAIGATWGIVRGFAG